MADKHDLAGAVAIVTGASAGYGVGIARVLKARGARVWITARREAQLTAVATELGVEAVVADVTRGEDWDRVLEVVTGATGGRLDVLVNNAGAGVRIAPAAQQTDEDVRICLDINLTGSILGAKRAAAVMQAQGSGTIINVSSICDRECWPGFSVYGAAKAGLLAFSKHLYAELREHGVRVTCLTPSWGDTEWAQQAGLPQQAAEVRAKMTGADELGELVAQICELPDHLVMPTVTLLPMVQSIVPF